MACSDEGGHRALPGLQEVKQTSACLGLFSVAGRELVGMMALLTLSKHELCLESSWPLRPTPRVLRACGQSGLGGAPLGECPGGPVGARA